MRVGVVCEGPTDFHAISQFGSQALSNRGLEVEFVDIQPQLGASLQGAGWPNAMLWLKKNPLPVRKLNYLSGGLFSGGLSAKACDALVVQVDADVLSDDDFKNYIKNNYGFPIALAQTPAQQFKSVNDALLGACGFADDLHAAEEKHVVAAAVQSTDTWCVGVFEPIISDVESLGKSAVLRELSIRLRMNGLSGARKKIKNSERRKKYCEMTKENISVLEASCPHFVAFVNMIAAIKS